MKVGDTVPVTIAGQVVAQAKVTEMGTDRATLLIPGTVVVMGVRTEIAPPEPVEQPVAEPETEHVIAGVEPTPVEQTAPVVEASAVETPVVETSTPEEQNVEQDTSD